MSKTRNLTGINDNQDFLIQVGDIIDALYVKGIFDEYPNLQRFSNLIIAYRKKCLENGDPPKPNTVKIVINHEKATLAAKSIKSFKQLTPETQKYIVNTLKLLKEIKQPHAHARLIHFMGSFLRGVKNNNIKRVSRIDENFKRIVVYQKTKITSL